jgi:hypothetical protein
LTRISRALKRGLSVLCVALLPWLCQADTYLKHKAVAGGPVARTSNSAASGLTGTSAAITTANITTPATNPLIVLHVALASATTTVTSITTTGFGGATGTLAVRLNGVNTAGIEIWCIYAPPASTTGTATINLSVSTAYSYSWTVFSGAHQTAPCPTGNTTTSNTATTPQTLTPSALAAGDATSASAANTGGLSFSSAAPNQRYIDNSAAVNQVTGDATGTTGVTITTTGGNAFNSAAARLVSAP